MEPEHNNDDKPRMVWRPIYFWVFIASLALYALPFFLSYWL